MFEPDDAEESGVAGLLEPDAGVPALDADALESFAGVLDSDEYDMLPSRKIRFFFMATFAFACASRALASASRVFASASRALAAASPVPFRSRFKLAPPDLSISLSDTFPLMWMKLSSLGSAEMMTISLPSLPGVVREHMSVAPS